MRNFTENKNNIFPSSNRSPARINYYLDRQPETNPSALAQNISRIDLIQNEIQFNKFRKPIYFVCKDCAFKGNTKIYYKIGTTTVVLSLLLCAIIIILTWLPCALDSMKDAVHECPNCHNEQGRCPPFVN